MLDLTGAGIRLTSLAGSAAYFDYSGSGFSRHTGWIGAGEGLLVLDDGAMNGHVTADQLIGARTGNGFQDLAALDSNGDGKISADDETFGRLRVWVDSGLDGESSSGELHTLADLGITSIDLTTETTHQTINGNSVVKAATFTLNNVDSGGETVTREVGQVNFTTNRQQTIYTLPEGFHYSQQALKLPELDGYGLLPDLRIAMTLNSQLATDVRSFVLGFDGLSSDDFQSAFEALVDEWVGVQNVDRTSKGDSVDARHLAVVFAYYGIDPNLQPEFAANPNMYSGPRYEAIYSSIISAFETRFLSQIPLAQIQNGANLTTVLDNPYLSFSLVNFNSRTDSVSADFPQLIEALAAGAPSDPSGAAVYWDKVLPIVAGLSVDLFGADKKTLALNFLMEAEKQGLSRTVETELLGLLSMSAFDPAEAAGVVSGLPNDTYVYLDATDTLVHSGYGDTFVYGPHAGADLTIEASDSTSRLLLTGVSSTEVTFLRPDLGADLLIVNNANGQTIRVVGYFGATSLSVVAFSGNSTSIARSQMDGILAAETQSFLVNPANLTLGLAEIKARLLAFGNGSVLSDRADTLLGTTSDDILISGGPCQTLSGSGGNDTYVYARGDGNDTIVEEAWSGNSDRVMFSGLNPADVTLVRSGNDLLIQIAERAPGADDAGSILVKNTLDDSWGQGVESLVFADGTTWTIADIRAKLLVQAATTGNDTIVGFNTDDTLAGGKGDDVLNGGAGNDTYVYARGDGNDTITEDAWNGNHDRIVFSHLDAGDVTLVRSGNDLLIQIAESAPGAGDAGSILVKNTLDDNWGQGVESIVFADGTTWSIGDVRAKLLVQAATAGNDTIVGFNTDDTLAGGKGDDVLNGGASNDTYVYAHGDGNDTIIEDAWNGNNDRIVFSNLNPGDVSLVRSGNDLLIQIAESRSGAGDTGSILVKNTLDDNWGQGVEALVFADGTTWSKADFIARLIDQAGTAGDDAIFGTNQADRLSGGRGDDTLNGGAGDDSYFYARGDGNDTIVEDAWNGNNDRFVFSNLNPGDVTLVRSGNDLLIQVAESAPGVGDAGSILVRNTLDANWGQGVESLVFADGTMWSIEDVRSKLLVQAATAGNDTLVGFNTDDTLAGGKGDDVLNGGASNDTYVYARGDGNDTIVEDAWNGNNDRIVFSDLNPGDVTLVRSGNDLLIQVAESAPGAGDAGSIVVKNTLDDSWGQGVERYVFADGTTWSIGDVRAKLLADAATAGNDTLVGFNTDDTLASGKGDDVLNGGASNDTYVYARGDGNDTIVEDAWNGNNDRIVFSDLNPGDVALVRSGNDLLIQVAESAPGAGDAGSILVKNTLDDSWGQGVERYVFADGTTWSIGDVRAKLLADAATAGNDTLVGFNTDDTLAGGKGDDLLNGGAGNDTYVYARGDSNDTITEDAWNGNNDRIVFSDLNPGDVTLVRSGNDLLIQVAESTPGAGDGGSIVAKNTLDDSWGQGVERFAFADGTIWSIGDVRAKLLTGAATAGNDTIVGFNTDDTLAGGKGDDVLNGGASNDTYVYARGDGNDTITEDSWNGNNDRIVFSDLNPADVTLLRSGNDLLIQIAESTPGAGDGGSIVAKNSLEDNWGQGLEALVFAAGIPGSGDSNLIWRMPEILTHLSVGSATSVTDSIFGTDGNDEIGGSDTSDVISGGAGDDRLFGNGGDDMVSGEGGSDFVRGGDGNDTVLGGDGTDELTGDWGNDNLDGGAGDDLLWAWTGNDTLVGGGGNDTLHGEGGDDTYGFGYGSGNDLIDDNGDTGASSMDRIVFDATVTAADVGFTRSGTDLVVHLAGATDTLTIQDGLWAWLNNSDYTIDRIEAFDFADGSHLDLAQVQATVLHGSDGNDEIGGPDTADVISGGAGDDRLFGNGGDDFVSGEGGSDFVRGGDGNDTVLGGDGTDELTGDWGNDNLDGGTGDDLLWAWTGNDTLVGGGGNDTLHGEGGDDTYGFGYGSGNDLIDDNGDTGVSSMDRIVFDATVTAADVGFTRSGTDLVVHLAGATDTLTIQDGLWAWLNNSDYTIDRIEAFDFADGSHLDLAQVQAAVLHGSDGNDEIAGPDTADIITGGGGDDRLFGNGGDDFVSGEGGSDFVRGGDGNDTVFGGDGNDELTGDWGNDSLDGGAGDDLLWAWTGNDTLVGGTGNDTLHGEGGNDVLVGGAGDDVYRYASGDGNDVIDDSDGTADRLVFANLTASDVQLLIVGDDLHLDVLGTGETITDVGHFTSATRGLDQIAFSGGTTWSRADIASYAVAA